MTTATETQKKPEIKPGNTNPAPLLCAHCHAPSIGENPVIYQHVGGQGEVPLHAQGCPTEREIVRALIEKAVGDNLKWTFCDGYHEYALSHNTDQIADEVMKKLEKAGCKLVYEVGK